MPTTGSCTVTEGKTFAQGEKIDNAKLNQAAKPSVRVDADSIGERELSAEDVRAIMDSVLGRTVIVDRSADHATPGIFQSADYVPGVFPDGQGTVGSSNFVSPTGTFTLDDNGRLILGAGIPAGTTITYVSGSIVTLSQNYLIQFRDGIIAGGTNLTSATAAFSPADNGRTVIGTGILSGTTMTYVSPTQATLSQAATDATAVIFQVNGRQATGAFTVVGRGRGWRGVVDTNGIGTFEIYAGTIAGTLASGTFAVGADGTLVLGTGPNKLVASPSGDFLWGDGPTALGITSDGKLFIGASAFSNGVVRISSNGEMTVLDLPEVNHNVASGALNPFVEPVVMTPAGGAIINPSDVTLTCATRYSRIYYRTVAKDGVTNTDTSFVSATANFTIRDVGKSIVGTNIAAGAYIKSVTNATTVVLSAATSGTGSSLEWYLVPDITDTLCAGPITLTATSKVAARAYKNGEYSDVAANLFTLDNTTVPNPTITPGAGTYGGGGLDVSLADALAGSSVRYTLGDGTQADPTTTTGTLISPASGATPPSGIVHLMTGNTVIKLVAFKTGVTTSPVVTASFTVTTSGGGKTASPTFNPGGFSSPGHGNQVVNMSTTQAGANIRYTKDLSKPTRTHGTLISGTSGTTTIPAGTDKILQAIAFMPDSSLLDSDVTTAEYDFSS
jgi:hypothetical protein